MSLSAPVCLSFSEEEAENVGLQRKQRGWELWSRNSLCVKNEKTSRMVSAPCSWECKPSYRKRVFRFSAWFTISSFRHILKVKIPFSWKVIPLMSAFSIICFCVFLKGENSSGVRNSPSVRKTTLVWAVAQSAGSFFSRNASGGCSTKHFKMWCCSLFFWATSKSTYCFLSENRTL